MNLQEAISATETHLARMDDLYGRKVFDEWSLVAVFESKARILHYAGPRREDLQRTFLDDLREFRAQLISGEGEIGGFDFARNATGTLFDAFIVAGEGCYLICNNTVQSMAGITREPRWLKAQIPFAELADRFRSSPLIHAT